MPVNITVEADYILRVSTGMAYSGFKHTFTIAGRYQDI